MERKAQFCLMQTFYDRLNDHMSKDVFWKLDFRSHDFHTKNKAFTESTLNNAITAILTRIKGNEG